MSAPKPASYRFTIKQMNANKINPIFTTNETGARRKQYQTPNSISEEGRRYFFNKIRKNGDLIGAEPGVYTWILKGTDFYATKVMSQQEIGTLHFILDQLTSEFDHHTDPIMAAGELLIKSDGTIQMNLLSGTYYKSFAYRGKVKKSEKQMTDLIEAVLGILRDHGVDNVEYVEGPSFIVDIKTSTANMNYFNAHFKGISQGGIRRKRHTRKTRKTRR